MSDARCKVADNDKSSEGATQELQRTHRIMSREANLRRFWPSDVFLGNGHLTRPRGHLHALSVGFEARWLLNSPGISDNHEAKIRVSRVAVGRRGRLSFGAGPPSPFPLRNPSLGSNARVSTPYNACGAPTKAVILIVDNNSTSYVSYSCPKKFVS